MTNYPAHNNITTNNSNELIGGEGGASISRSDSFAGQRPPIFSDGLQRSLIEPGQTFGTMNTNEVRTNSRTMEESGDKASAMAIASASGEGSRAPGLVQMGLAPAANIPAPVPAQTLAASDGVVSSHGTGVNLSLSLPSMGNYGSKRMTNIPEDVSNPRAGKQACTGGLIPNMSSTGGMASAVAPGLGFREILLHRPVDRSLAGSPWNLYRPVPRRLPPTAPNSFPKLTHTGLVRPGPSALAPAQNFPTSMQSPGPLPRRLPPTAPNSSPKLTHTGLVRPGPSAVAPAQNFPTSMQSPGPLPRRLPPAAPNSSPKLTHTGLVQPGPSALAPAQIFPTSTQSLVSDENVTIAGQGNGLSLSTVGKHGLVDDVLDSRAERGIKSREPAAKSHTASLIAKVAELEEENKRLREEKNRLNEENSRLNKENSRLSQENSRLDNRLRKEKE